MLVASLMLLRGKRLKGNAEGKCITFSVALVSGFVNGSTAVGGLPVVLILLFTSTGDVTLQVSLVAYLFCSKLAALGFSSLNRLITTELLLRTVFLPLIFIGIFAENRGFIRAEPDSFRPFNLSLLFLLCLLGMARMVFSHG